MSNGSKNTVVRKSSGAVGQLMTELAAALVEMESMVNSLDAEISPICRRILGKGVREEAPGQPTALASAGVEESLLASGLRDEIAKLKSLNRRLADIIETVDL